MEHQNLSNEQLIDELVAEAISYIKESLHTGETEVLESYFRQGFKGFESRSRDELLDEFSLVFGDEVCPYHERDCA